MIYYSVLPPACLFLTVGCIQRRCAATVARPTHPFGARTSTPGSRCATRAACTSPRTTSTAPTCVAELHADKTHSVAVCCMLLADAIGTCMCISLHPALTRRTCGRARAARMAAPTRCRCSSTCSSRCRRCCSRRLWSSTQPRPKTWLPQSRTRAPRRRPCSSRERGGVAASPRRGTCRGMGPPRSTVWPRVCSGRQARGSLQCSEDGNIDLPSDSEGHNSRLRASSICTAATQLWRRIS